MADIKISQLGSAIAVDDSDIVPVVSGGNTLKATAAQLKEHAIGNTSISGIGNGSVTGAISALNSDKQPKTLATPITVDGTPQTTVEGALGAINTDLGSTKQALTTVTRTGTSNSGTKIDKGTVFNLNGVLVQAIADIGNTANFISGTNYKALSSGDGALNDFNWKFLAHISVGDNMPTQTGAREYLLECYTPYWVISQVVRSSTANNACGVYRISGKADGFNIESGKLNHTWQDSVYTDSTGSMNVYYR